jgi:hypothetical protein
MKIPSHYASQINPHQRYILYIPNAVISAIAITSKT